jgi:membrane protein implicated in regulation of membrane protease activity
MTFLRRAWSWIVAALGSALLAVAMLWRRAARQRDEARDQRDAAAASAGRTERLRDAETRARDEVEAVHRELDAKARSVTERTTEARVEVRDARGDEALARLVEERRKAGRLP